MNAKLGWDTAVAASEPLFAEVVQLKAEIERLKAERDRLAAEIERLRAIIQFSVDRVSKIAFDIPPPNEQTPPLVMLANGMRAALAKEGT